MDVGTIIVLAIAATGVGFGIYFQFTGKKNIARAIYLGIGVFMAAIGFLDKKKFNKIKEKAKEVINESKANDENRTEVIEKIDDRVKSNKELIDEINEALNSD
jgi:hypothetical protein